MKEIACIVAAGKGTRSFHYPYLHKALLPLGNKAVISRCIDILSEGGIKKFVIALQKGEENQIRSFIEAVHNDKKIIFNICDAHDGENVGPGRTLELCNAHLNSPFIALGCDTLGKFNIACDGDWITTTKKFDWEANDIEGEYAYYDYRSKEIKRGLSTRKIKENPNTDFFSGVIGVHDYSKFWENTSKWNSQKIEKPIYAGFFSNSFETNNLDSWIDTGSEISYKYARGLFKEIVEPKPNQEIFIYEDKVVKFFKNKKVCNKILKRHELLKPFTPTVNLIDKYLIIYPFIQGKLLSETKEKKFVEILLNYFEKQINRVKPKNTQLKDFKNNCYLMWFKKLEERINDFDSKMKTLDKVKYINGLEVDCINELIKCIDKEKFLNLCKPCFFHGDPSPENILFDNQDNLRLIDPRPVFGESDRIGDLYYELAKLDHALIVNGKLIRNNDYGYKLINNNKSQIWIKKPREFVFFREQIYEFCLKKNWSTENLSLATSLTLLSISTVHTNKKYNHFLLLAGKYLLKLSLENQEKNRIINKPISINS